MKTKSCPICRPQQETRGNISSYCTCPVSVQPSHSNVRFHFQHQLHRDRVCMSNDDQWKPVWSTIAKGKHLNISPTPHLLPAGSESGKAASWFFWRNGPCNFRHFGDVRENEAAAADKMPFQFSVSHTGKFDSKAGNLSVSFSCSVTLNLEHLKTLPTSTTRESEHHGSCHDFQRANSCNTVKYQNGFSFRLTPVTAAAGKGLMRTFLLRPLNSSLNWTSH